MTRVPATHYVLEDRSAFLAACITSAVGSLVFNAFPLFLSATADQYGLNLEQIGWLASIYLIGFAAITLVAPVWMNLSEWRLSGMVSSVLMVGAVVSWGFTDNVTLVYAAYCVLGAGAGMVFTIGLTILARARDPESAFGVKLMWEMGLAGLVMFLMTKWIITAYGFTGFVIGTAIAYVACMAFVKNLPDNFLKRERGLDEERAVNERINPLPAWVAIVALFIQFAAFSALWGFMEAIGDANGLSNETIGTILTFSIVAGFAGASLAAWLGNRYGHIWPLNAGLVFAAVAVVLLAFETGAAVYVFSACVINGMLQYTIAYQMGLVAHNDFSGRIGVMIPFILASSASVGPPIAGTIAEAQGFTLVYWGFVAVTAVTILLSVWVGRQNPLKDQIA